MCYTIGQSIKRDSGSDFQLGEKRLQSQGKEVEKRAAESHSSVRGGVEKGKIWGHRGGL